MTQVLEEIEDDIEEDDSVTCVHCEGSINLDDFRKLLSANLTAEERGSIVGSLAAAMRHTIGTQGGRPKDTEQARCPCGMMTLNRAMTRRHFDSFTGRCRYVHGNVDSERYYERYHKRKKKPA